MTVQFDDVWDALNAGLERLDELGLEKQTIILLKNALADDKVIIVQDSLDPSIPHLACFKPETKWAYALKKLRIQQEPS